MNEQFYLVECMFGSEFNIYSGSEKECNDELTRILTIQGDAANAMYVTENRFE